MANCSNCGIDISKRLMLEGPNSHLCHECHMLELKEQGKRKYLAMKNSGMSNNEIILALQKERESIDKKLINTQIQNLELNTMQKLQFNKFISEQSGMNLQEVEKYIETISKIEKEELIQNFKIQSRIEFSKQNITTNIPTIRVLKDESDNPSCPRCTSKQVTYNKQGFGFGKAFLGGILTGGIGLLAGGINKNKIIITCLKCGKAWSP